MGTGSKTRNLPAFSCEEGPFDNRDSLISRVAVSFAEFTWGTEIGQPVSKTNSMFYLGP